MSKMRPSPAVEGAGRAGHGSVRSYFDIAADENGSEQDAEEALAKVRKAQGSRENPGNAPPMRALPLAFFEGDVFEYLNQENADASHPHPSAIAASFCMALAARFLMLEGGNKNAVISHVVQKLRASKLSYKPSEDYLERVATLPDYHAYGPRLRDMPPDDLELLCGPQPNPYMGNQFGHDGLQPMHGMPCDAIRTVGTVLYILRFHQGPMDALRTACDMGGDVDSSCALCLGVVGGAEGLGLGRDGGIPWFCVDELEGVEYLVQEALKFETWLSKQGHHASL